MSDLVVQDKPFRHVVVDGWWPVDQLRAVVKEFPSPNAPGWRRYSNTTERKLEGPPGLWGPKTRALFTAIEARTGELGQAFGIKDLAMETIGGGYHLIEPGGYLNIHSDFSVSPRTGRYRRLNVLLYLNEGWHDPGGHLELWDDRGPVSDIAPELNRTVIFETSATSWHGHPRAASRTRRSVAAYMFTADPPPGYAGDQSTVWWAPR